jgi:hypothetical protein
VANGPHTRKENAATPRPISQAERACSRLTTGCCGLTYDIGVNERVRGWISLRVDTGPLLSAEWPSGQCLLIDVKRSSVLRRGNSQGLPSRPGEFHPEPLTGRVRRLARRL